MKKARLLYYSTLLVAGCTFTACEDDAELPNKTDLLTGKDWKMTAASVAPGIPDGNGGTIRDVYARYPSCRQDDLLRFETPSTLKELSGPSMCTGDVASKTGTWSFSSDQKQLYLVRQGKSTTDDYSVDELTSSSMRLKTTERSNGVDYTFTYTYARQ
ncbi:hypothetical protein [Hymenobacter latericus]|uniref:hypothetical protein n=1 Tax=Hymenobacter sp. YIM 151858-1 TaxID=2987688 RepID=UPI002226F0EA|nr:hypothetical protein [Hymenobacter sp. YIM 151858-1]UYZ58597.1 hypothetical protein OIS50_16235 [Hymenobacter sp. YIM 151858-1]